MWNALCIGRALYIYYKNRWKNFSDECPKCAKSHISASCYFIPNMLFTGSFMWEWLCLPCLFHNCIIPQIQQHLGPWHLGNWLLQPLWWKHFLAKSHSYGTEHDMALWFHLPWKKKYLILRLWHRSTYRVLSHHLALLFLFAELWQGGCLNFNVCQFLTSSQRLK